MRPEIRSTRRGWMMFLATPNDGSGGGVDQAAIDAAAAEKAKTDAATASGPLDYKTLLVTLLDLDPATADDAAIKDAFDAEEAKPEVDVAALQTQASSAAELQRQLDEISQKYTELNDQQQALYKAKQEADADEILAVYAGCFTDDNSKAAIRNILLNDKEAGIAILNGLKKPDAAAPSGPETPAEKKTTPPAATHDPAAQTQQVSEEERAAKISARAKELVAQSKPKISLTKAYQMAEAELEKEQAKAA